MQPPPKPWHLVAQQAMALVLQHAGALGSTACHEQLASLFPELPRDGIQAVLSFMLETGVLAEQDGQTGFGQRGEKLYGRQNFLDLLSSFASPIQFQVMHGGSDLGVVDPLSLKTGADGPCILLLGGRSWHVTSVDWPKRVAWVEPTRKQGKARWMGSSRSLGYTLCQAIRHVLCGALPDVSLSKRANTRLEEIRANLPEMSVDRITVERLDDGRFRWWTFAGGRANATLAGMLRTEWRSIRADDFYLEAQGEFNLNRVREVVAVADPAKWVGSLAKAGALNVKFIESLPESAIYDMTLGRVLDAQTARKVAEGLGGGMAACM